MITVAYPDKATLAAELCVSKSTVEDLVRRGVLPQPLKLSPGCLRWDWADVVRALAKFKGAGEDSDPFMAGARDACSREAS